MNAREWLRLYSLEKPKTIVFYYKRLYFVVFCGRCLKMLPGPWYGNEWWERDEQIGIINVWCRQCGNRNRVNKAWAFVSEAEEIEEWMERFSDY